ncbi:hypothetical protein TruAng_012232 [Truncatella angustata]|nr:hypothetical protein TruAng_012232 [Truncatella angustata]
MLVHWTILPICGGLVLAAPTTHAPDPTALLPRVATAATVTTTSAMPTGTFMTTLRNIEPGVTNDHVTIPANTIDIVIPTCIQTIIPDANGYVPPGTCGALWEYYPSFIAAVVFAALFTALTIVHIWQAVHYKKVSTSSMFMHPEWLELRLMLYRGGVGS